MLKKNKNAIVKFDFRSEQTVGGITKINGLVRAKYLVSVIDCLDLDANPRSSKTGPVTDAIQDSINNDPLLFPFKTKGILLASSSYEVLDRNRLKLLPENLKIEGILDGGHNTLAIGLYILNKAMDYAGRSMPKGNKTWEEFKNIWHDNRDVISGYLEHTKNDDGKSDVEFYVPVELLVPQDPKDFACVAEFKNDLLEICAARNNNVQLQISAKANQRGYFDSLRELMEQVNPKVSERVEWKTNDGGDIKVQDIVALAWIPLGLMSPVKDHNGRVVEAVAANKLYSAKGSCLNQFDKLMSSIEVTSETEGNYKREVYNDEVLSAFRITVDMPMLYDYIYDKFPSMYNSTGGSYGRINAVKKINEKRKVKRTPFGNEEIVTLSPDGFIMPLVFGLQALMERKEVNGKSEIRWVKPPMEFLRDNLEKIVAEYSGNLSVCDYDPQKVGKAPQCYSSALAAYKMALAGIL